MPRGKHLLELIADSETRVEAASALAAHHGAVDCIFFIEDEEIGRLLPAPGFTRTLPDRAAWSAFLDMVQQQGSATRKLWAYGNQDPVLVTGFDLGHGGVITFIAQLPVQNLAVDLMPALAIIVRLLQQEHRVSVLDAKNLMLERRTREFEAWSVRLEQSQEELNLALIAARVAKSCTENTLEGIEDAFVMVDADGAITYLNSVAENLFGFKSVAIGTCLNDLAASPHSVHVMHAWRDARERKQSVVENYEIAANEAAFVVRAYPSIDGAILFISNVSLQRNMERLVDQLSTPVLLIAHRMLLLPLIGHIDEARARQMLNQYSVAIKNHRALAAIIDITGVFSIGRETAQLLLSAVRASRVLGCTTFTVGISPEVAGSFVDAGIDAGLLEPRADLRAGIEAGFSVLGASA